MLSLMRKHAGTWIIKVLLGAIVVVFVFWGVGSYTDERSSRVASVNGDWITLDQYKATYNNLLEQVRQTFGNRLNDDLLKSLQLRKRALDQLIDNMLMLQAAEKLSLSVSNQELAQAIQQFGAFQSDGAFDSRRYQTVLSRNNLTPEAFEVLQREAMLIGKLREFITGTIKVSDREALEWYKWNNLTTSIEYALFDPERYKGLTPTEEELNEYFAAHKTSYKTEPQIKVRYLSFKPDLYKSQVHISEDEIRDYYETHPEDYNIPKTVEARHILIKVEQDASEEAVAKAREAIDNILEMARKGEDFEELAKQYSQGPSKDKGGYLGSFRKESMVKPFADKAFSMNAGEISEPVRTRFGWHIIKVEKVNPATTLSIEEAKSEIREKLTGELSKTLAYEDAEAAYDASFEGDNLETIAASRNLTIMETDFFTEKKPPAGLKDGAQFATFAFEQPDKEISDIKEFSDGYYLIQPVEKIPSKTPEITVVKDKVIADWIKDEQQKKARDDAVKLLADLSGGQSMQSATEKFKVAAKQTDFFKRNDSIPDIGFEPEIARVAFSLSEKEDLPQEPIKGQKGYYVIRFKQRKEAPIEGFDKEKAEIEQNLLQQKRFKIFDAWLQKTRTSGEISIAEAFQEG
jgi:peptidyl-prolyl cis-trans isomerase D